MDWQEAKQSLRFGLGASSRRFCRAVILRIRLVYHRSSPGYHLASCFKPN